MVVFLGVFVVCGALLAAAMLWMIEMRKRKEKVVGFFHPYTNDGGGGERVLWCAVKATQEMVADLRVAIYTGDPATSESLQHRAFEKFGVTLTKPLIVVQLRKRKWVEPSTFPRFTLIGQSLGSIVLAWEALSKMTPLLFVDTSGYAFTYPLARLFGCNVACYTHYPTISSDMLDRVRTRTSLYNNNASIASSYWLSLGKLLYYRTVAYMYGWAGCCTHLAMVNSSWTQAHIEQLWKIPNRTVKVYPPCDTFSLQALSLERPAGTLWIISVAQFRPEKAHVLQLEAFANALLQLCNQSTSGIVWREVRLKLVGSCRHKEDEKRVSLLRNKCFDLGIDNQVDFCINVPYRELVSLLAKSIAGLHTMVDEHFGISVVEYMAAGAIPIGTFLSEFRALELFQHMVMQVHVSLSGQYFNERTLDAHQQVTVKRSPSLEPVKTHRSAGPMLDIVVEEGGQKTGFLATNVEEYAEAMCRVLTMSREERLVMSVAARKRALRFSSGKFDNDFKVAMRPLFDRAEKSQR